MLRGVSHSRDFNALTNATGRTIKTAVFERQLGGEIIMKKRISITAFFLAGCILMIERPAMAAEGDPGAAGMANPPAATPSTQAETTGTMPIPATVVESSTGTTNTIIIPATGAEDTKKEEIITVHLDNVELVDVVKMFTRITPANIITTGTNLTGQVTVHVQDKPWKVALDSILDQRGLRLDDPQGKGVFSIVAKGNQPDPLVTETVFLKYAEVPNVIKVVQNTLDPRGKISDFSSRNAMVIQSTTRNMSEIRAIIEQIDIPRKQVVIEAKFVELSDTDGSKIGIGWDKMLDEYSIGGAAQILNAKDDLTVVNGRTGTLNKKDTSTSSDTANNTYTTVGSTMVPLSRQRTIMDTRTPSVDATYDLTTDQQNTYNNIRTAVLNPLQVNLLLSALKSRVGSTILSNPKIIVANGEQAMIHIGEERRPFIATVTPATQISGPMTTYNPGEVIQFGVKIVVTPTVNTDSNITVMIEPEITRLSGMDKSPDGANQYPIKATKKIKTQFLLENWKTAAIGGLTETTDDKTTTKIPLLGDIPLLGKYLFSRETKQRIQQEMIIFVTVGLVSAESASEKTGVPSNAELIHSQTVNRDLESKKFQNDLEQMQNAAKQRTERSEKRKKLLLDRAR